MFNKQEFRVPLPTKTTSQYPYQLRLTELNKILQLNDLLLKFNQISNFIVDEKALIKTTPASKKSRLVLATAEEALKNCSIDLEKEIRLAQFENIYKLKDSPIKQLFLENFIREECDIQNAKRDDEKSWSLFTQATNASKNTQRENIRNSIGLRI